MKAITAAATVLVFIGMGPILLRAADEPARVKVLIVDGYGNHDWARTSQLVRSILEPTGLFAITVSTAPANTNVAGYSEWLPGFAGFDVVIQTCNDIGRSCPLWPSSARAAFESFVAGGGGVFVLHSGNNAFAEWEAYNWMIGLGWRPKTYGWAMRITPEEKVERIPPGQGAGTSHGARTDRVIHRLGDHPIHQGLPRAWKTPLVEVYTHARGPAENVTILSYAADPATGERWPVEWTVEYEKGRIYTSTMGHVWRDEGDPVNMRCLGFRTILIRALQWLAERPVTYPLPAEFPSTKSTSLAGP